MCFIQVLKMLKHINCLWYYAMKDEINISFAMVHALFETLFCFIVLRKFNEYVNEVFLKDYWVLSIDINSIEVCQLMALLFFKISCVL